MEAQMAALQAQVEPHFLFNTLALIGQLIETDPPEAARVHAHLIEYLRSTLPQMRARGGATLGKQVELSRAYLAIMQARMKERLQVRFEVPDFLGSAPFPPMMLQTLIENSIKHGLEPKIEGGTIVVRACVVDGAICRSRCATTASASTRTRTTASAWRISANACSCCTARRPSWWSACRPAAAPAPRSSCRTR
jgi:sensor histidine kinase YesM